MAESQRRTAVITGASSGIGQATALAFAAKGWSVVLAARRREDLEAVAAQCRAIGAAALVVPTDVGDAAAVKALAEAARAWHGTIDLWLSNVGVGAVGRFLDVPVEVHDQIIRANLIGHVNDAHAVLPIFIAQGRGVFVNMISLCGFFAVPYAVAYSASKFGLEGFAEALRAELAEHPDVHLCNVYPALVDTPALLHAANYMGKALSPPPPLLDPRRVADAIVALADRPRASVYVGAVTWATRIAHATSPMLSARVTKALFDRRFARAVPAVVTDGNVLNPPGDGARIDGGQRPSPRRRSYRAGILVAGALAAAGVALLARSAASARNG